MTVFSTKTNIPPSATLAVNSLAQAKKAAGERVYNLSAGEPIISTGHYFKPAINQALDEGKVLYPPVPGIEELRIKAAEWMNQNYHSNYTKNNTLISCGGKFGIYLLLQALLNDGDEVIILAPYWVSYPPMVQLFGGVPVIVETKAEKGFKVNPDDIAAAITTKTKMIIFNNASNPTGVLYTKSEIEAILKLTKAKNITLLSDEVYSGLTYDGDYYSCAAFPEYRNNVAVIQSCSKNFGMTGFRVGMIFAPEDITKMLIKLQGQSITGTSIISQYAALEALKNATAITAEIKTEMQNRRDIFTDTFNQIFTSSEFGGDKIVAPKSAFYSFIPLSAFGQKISAKFFDDIQFCEKVLGEGNVAIVPGSAFGAPGYVRASFGARPEELQAALFQLQKYLTTFL